MSTPNLPDRKIDVEEFKRLELEYKGALDVLKQYTTLQFAQLTAFLVINGSTLSFLLAERKTVLSESTFHWAVVLACIASGLLWVAQESMMKIVRHFMLRIKDLEETLKFKGFATLPGMNTNVIQPGRWALSAFYALTTLCWLSLAMGWVGVSLPPIAKP